MTALPFIAELHDIGKLVDWDGPGLAGSVQPGSPRHAFHSFDFSKLGIAPPISPSWWGQWSDTLKDLRATEKLPANITDDGKTCVLLTNIADVLAASISRTWGRKGNIEQGVHLLWNPSYYQEASGRSKTWAAFRTVDELKDMFRFIDTCRAPEEFLKSYSEPLLLTPEDKSVPLNFIPLRTHLELTGKAFRVLRYHTRVVRNGDHIYLEYDREVLSRGV